jgi:hypothetical protein
MTDRLLRFGNGARSYDFTQDFIHKRSLPGGFGDAITNAIRLVGIQGGYNQDGRDRARRAIGNLQASFIIRADGTAAVMAAKQRAIYAMLDWGEMRLFKEFGDAVQVWTWATVSNVQMTQRDEDLSYIWQNVQINFNCPKALWYGKPDMLFFEDAWVLDDGLSLSVPKVDQQSVGNGSTVAIDNDGNATIGAYVRWDIPTGVSVLNPSITRRNEANEIVDQITYEDTLVADDVVEIDSRDHQTTKNLVVVPSYQALDALSGAWLEIPPGTTTLEIGGTFTGGNALLTLDCWDGYY